MTSLRHAFGFLTIFPVGPLKTPPTAWSTAYFPLVGLALGGILAGLDLAARQVLPMPVVGALLLVALLITTRAIHIEGFLDSCDGLLGGRNRTQRLGILRDSRVGAFAVVGGVGLLLLKWTLLVNAPIEVRTEMLVLFPCLSRFGMLSTMVAFSYVREQGLGTSFRIGRSRWQLALGFIIAAVAAGVLMDAAGLILMTASLATSLALGWWVSRLIGGMTGDTYGAVNEVAEVSVLLLATALFPVMTILFRPFLW